MTDTKRLTPEAQAKLDEYRPKQEPDSINSFMHNICPFRIGSRVRVSPAARFADEWRDVYCVVMIEWTYNKGSGHDINIAIASDDDIKRRHGWTDGWSPDDLVPAP